MDKKLLIVESPNKIKKISSFLGPEYIVKASFGHIRDLEKKELSIDHYNPSENQKESDDLYKDLEDLFI